MTNKEPLMINAGDNIESKIKTIPNLGKSKVKGWRLVQIYFVDSSGFGQSGEPALTFPEFLNKVKVGRAYGIVSAGQFQVNIGEYVKKK
jgi:hypothetical protein